MKIGQEQPYKRMQSDLVGARPLMRSVMVRFVANSDRHYFINCQLEFRLVQITHVLAENNTVLKYALEWCVVVGSIPSAIDSKRNYGETFTTLRNLFLVYLSHSLSRVLKCSAT